MKERSVSLCIAIMLMIFVLFAMVGGLYLKAKHDLHSLLTTKTNTKYSVELKYFDFIGVCNNRIALFVFTFRIFNSPSAPRFQCGITTKGIEKDHSWGY